MTPAGMITKSRKNFPTVSYRAASTMLPIPLPSFSPDFKASKVRNHMSLTQFAFILESILPHGFFTVKTFWQQTDSISRKARRSAALQRTGGLLQLFPLGGGNLHSVVPTFISCYILYVFHPVFNVFPCGKWILSSYQHHAFKVRLLAGLSFSL